MNRRLLALLARKLLLMQLVINQQDKLSVGFPTLRLLDSWVIRKTKWSELTALGVRLVVLPGTHRPPTSRGNGASVGGLERQVAFSTVLEKKKRVTASLAGPIAGLTSWELARPSSHEVSHSSWQSQTRIRKTQWRSFLFEGPFSLTATNSMAAYNLATLISQDFLIYYYLWVFVGWFLPLINEC